MWTTTDAAGKVTARSPVYSGGAATYYGGSHPYSFSNGTYNGSRPGTCGGQIKAIFTWKPDYPGDLPPTQVVTTQNSTAGLGRSDTSATPCANGLGNPQLSGISQGTLYKAAASGSTVEVDCTPTISPFPVGAGYAYVTYTASVSPVFVNPGGAVKDNSGNYNILVGQNCLASLSGVPGSCTVSNYQWGVTGPTFQTWQSQTPSFPVMVGTVQIGIIPANLDATYEVDGPGPLTNSTARWYWNEVGKNSSKAETVSCTATVTPPAGQGTPFSVTVTQPVSVWSPAWTCTGSGASVVVDNKYPGGPGFWLHAGPGPMDVGVFAGMTWDATLNAPSSPVSFGTGILVMAQIITGIDSGYTTDTTPALSFPSSDNGQTGLDTLWPYPWTTVTLITPYKKYESGDSPGTNVDVKRSAHDNISFTDYLMYIPPGSLQYVTVAKYVWSANMGASLPSTGNWINFTGTAGTVTDAQRSGNFLPSNEFPAWTHIVQ